MGVGPVNRSDPRESILALDASTTACSAAVTIDGHLVAHRFEEMDRGQAERLNPMIGEVMAEASLAFRDIGLVAVTTGPGAFTGLRIGIACARAIALASGAGLRGVTTFEALARAVPDDEMTEGGPRTLVVCVNGKRRDVFAQHYDQAAPVGDPYALLPADAPAMFASDRFLLAGDGAAPVAAALQDAPETATDTGKAAKFRIRLSGATRPPDARHVAALASGPDIPGPPPRPFYIRPPDVRLPGARAKA